MWIYSVDRHSKLEFLICILLDFIVLGGFLMDFALKSSMVERNYFFLNICIMQRDSDEKKEYLCKISYTDV